VPTFTFTIVVPPEPGLQELLESLSRQVARYAGLGPLEAEQTWDAMRRAVADTARGDGPVSVTFRRAQDDARVGIEITAAGSSRTLSWPPAPNGG
jgi:hypothetical protein